MPHIVDQLQAEAAAAIAAMRDTALHARQQHARAELLRHMHQTAAKLAALPEDQAIARVVSEWMRAWHIDTERYAELAEQVRRFAAAFCTDARGSTPATQAAIRDATETLDAAFVRHGSSLADQDGVALAVCPRLVGPAGGAHAIGPARSCRASRHSTLPGRGRVLGRGLC